MSKTTKVITGANYSLICYDIFLIIVNNNNNNILLKCLSIQTQRTLHKLKLNGYECFYKVRENYFSA